MKTVEKFLLCSVISIALGGCGIGGCIQEMGSKAVEKAGALGEQGKAKLGEIKDQIESEIEAAEQKRVAKFWGIWRATLSDGNTIEITNMPNKNFSAIVKKQGRFWGATSSELTGTWKADDYRFLVQVESSSNPDLVPTGVLIDDEIVDSTDHSFSINSAEDGTTKVFRKVAPLK